MKSRVLFLRKKTDGNIQEKLGSNFEPFFMQVIETIPIDNTKDLSGYSYFIITSKKAVDLFVKQKDFPKNSIFYVVGETSAAALRKMNFEVDLVAKNAEELAEGILIKDKPLKFMHLCSDIALDTLGQRLRENGLEYVKNPVYKTKLLYPENERAVDALVFFSPSGVESFCEKNKIRNEVLFSIGATTKTALRERTKSAIITSKKETLNDLILEIKKYYND